MKRLPICFLSFIVIAGIFYTSCLAQNENEATMDHYTVQNQLAQNYIRQKNYTEAVKIFEQLRKEFPDNTHIAYLCGILRHKLGRLDEAKNDYELLIDRDAADSLIYNNLGVIYAANKKLDKAQQWFTRATREKPQIAQAHNNLAELFIQKKAYDDAISEYNKVIEIEKNNVGVLYNLGVTYTKIGDFESARIQWERALAINPDDDDVKKILEQAKIEQRRLKMKEN